MKEGKNLQPKNILQSFPKAEVRKAVDYLMTTFSEEPHLIIVLESWGLDLPFPPKMPFEVEANLAVFSPIYGIHVVSLVKDGHGNDERLWEYAKLVAISLKQALIIHGGCGLHLGIKVVVLDIHSPIMLEVFQASIDLDIHPQQYRMQEQAMELILNSLAIAIASYKPFR